MVLLKPAYVVVRVQVKPAAGMGFVGTGAGWTSPTRTVPVCHPTHGYRYLVPENLESPGMDFEI